MRHHNLHNVRLVERDTVIARDVSDLSADYHYTVKSPPIRCVDGTPTSG
jgi:hypothetical protein